MTATQFSYIVEHWASFVAGVTPDAHRDEFQWPFDPNLTQPISLDERRLLVGATPDVIGHLSGRESQLADAINGLVRSEPPTIDKVELVEVPGWGIALIRRLNET